MGLSRSTERFRLRSARSRSRCFSSAWICRCTLDHRTNVDTASSRRASRCNAASLASMPTSSLGGAVACFFILFYYYYLCYLKIKK